MRGTHRLHGDEQTFTRHIYTTLTRQIERDAQTPWGRTDINTTYLHDKINTTKLTRQN